ncbi:PQQ-binding-like beta-propeller repeat protein [bacterium]|nr:PQQ-binding-like beta-propeller repeat protein [bacterium]
MFRFAKVYCSLLLLIVCSCSQGNPGGSLDAANSQQSLPAVQITPDLKPEQFPSALPADGVQPWESLDADGYVVPSGRSASSINLNTDFTPGVERFLDSGDAADKLEATRLNGISTTGISSAMYRISMGAEQPGIVSVDANLISGKGYYVGLSNYGTGRWDWQGPFIDNHVRLQAVTDSSGDLTSAIGNTFVSVLCPAGSSADVVGIGVNQYDPASATAPATPLGLTVAPVPGGLELNWSPVLDPDLAGYAICHSAKSFSNPQAVGVQRVPYLEGSARHLLGGITGNTFVALAGVDFSGNESLPTPLVQAAPLPGGSPLQLISSAPSGMLNDTISLSASGASSYDWDLDGDGVFEIQNDNSGSQAALTTATGIIRPRVVGRDSAGNHTALGGISLIISGNSRPVASANATPATGDVPLDLTLTGIAEDAEDSPAQLSYAWDLDADGIYDDDTDLTEIPLTYNVPGLYNVKFRVTDSQGAWDVDTISVLATGDDPSNQAPAASFTDTQISFTSPFLFLFDASGSSDPDGSIVLYEWDFTNDGNFDERGQQPFVQHSLLDFSENIITLRVTDDKGGTAETFSFLRLPSAWPCYAGNHRGSGYSGEIAPQSFSQLFSVQTSSPEIQSQPVFGPDGTMYVCGNGYELMSINPQSGAENWKLLGSSFFSPAVDALGNIYYSNQTGELRCVSSGGLLQWEVTGLDFQRGSVNIDLSGNVYVGHGNNFLDKYSADGKLQWSHDTGGIPRQGCVVDYNGTVYATLDSGVVRAISSSGEFLWDYVSGSPANSRAVLDPSGNLYIATDRLHAINPDGTNRWIFGTSRTGYSSVASDLYGNVIFTNGDSGGVGTVYSLTTGGVENWHFDVSGEIFGPPAVDLLGGIYCTTNADGHIYALNSSGTLLWSALIGETVFTGPSIGPNGILYQCDSAGGLSAVSP